MSVTVRVLPSGHEFVVDRNETILDAGLRAGLALHYRCSNGSCGECKAWRVSGELKEIGFHDYHFTEAEKQTGAFLMCRTTALSDVVIEAPEARGVDDIPLQEIKTKVTKLESLAEDLRVVHLRTPRSQTLRFLAGQYVTLEIDKLPPRDKSIASCPCNGRLLQVHFRHRVDDIFPEHVFTRLRSGDPVVITGPFGDFTLREESARPILFIAYETGFASIKSLIEHAIALDLTQPIHLCWIVEKPGGHYMHNQCRAWADSLDNFCYSPVSVPRGRDPEQGGVGAALQQVLEHYSDLTQHDVYMSVPVYAGQPLQSLLASRGLPEHALRMELLEKY